MILFAFFQTEAELMAREHEAGKGSLMEILRFAKRERDNIVSQIDDLKSRSLLHQDRATLVKLLENFESDFDRNWQDRKRSLTRHAKFCLFTSSLKQLGHDLHELHETIKIKTSLGETISSVNASSNFLQSIVKPIDELRQRIKFCHEEGDALGKEMPVHSATISLGLSQIDEKWDNLHELLAGQKQKLKSAAEYFKMVENSETFLKEANKSILSWSRRISGLASENEARKLKQEIDQYIKVNKTVQIDTLLKISTVAGQIFGQNDYQKSQIVQKEQNDTFDALYNLLQQIENYFSHRKSIDEEEVRKKRFQAETEANIRAAKAEAEAAKRAAKQAEEARKAAEEATLKALSEVKVMQVSCIETQTDLDEKTPPRPPQPKEEEIRPVAPLFTEYLQDVVLQEGSKCQLKARVSGIPTPQITWFKDGVPVRNNSDYKADFQNGLCTLTIEETFVDDSANWSVRASNPAGYAESHAKLTVQEIKPVEEMNPPEIVIPLKDGHVDEGGVYEFRCKIRGRPPPQISWFKNGICVDRARSFTIGEHDGECVLRIDKVYLEDSTEFSIKATNHLGSVTTSAKLHVKPLQPTEMPEFDEPLPNVDVVVGNPVLLECHVHGLPKPQISWYHNNKLLRKNVDTEMCYDGQKAALKITRAFPKASGNYVCKARNIAGEATSTSIVSVKALPPETSDSEVPEVEMVKSQYKPAFYVPLRNLEATEGEEVILECVIIGHPEPEVIWYRNNVPVKESANLQLLFQGDSCKLLLRNVTKDQTGEYKVRAVNSLGECQSTCQLKVNPSKRSSAIATQTTDTGFVHEQHSSYSESLMTERSEEITNNITYVAQASVKTKPKKMLAPKFISNMKGGLVEEGGNVILEVNWEGTPEPKIIWLCDGIPVQTRHDIQIEFGNQSSRLFIKKVLYILVF